MATTTTLEQISAEKQRITTKLTSIDAQRAKMQYDFDEIEAAERVMARYGTQPGVRRRGRPQKAAQELPMPTTTPAAMPAAPRKAPKATRGNGTASLSDKVLSVVTAAPSGIAKSELASSGLFKGSRANHVGVALSRHKKAGRIIERDGKLYLAGQERDIAA